MASFTTTYGMYPMDGIGCWHAHAAESSFFSRLASLFLRRARRLENQTLRDKESCALNNKTIDYE